jgi:hypothetical protein
MPLLRIRGYPLSQLVISGGIALCVIVLPFLARSKGTVIPLHFLALLGVIVAAALYSVLAYPFVTVEIDAARSEVMVRWSWAFGFISRTRSISVNRIEKIVYSATDFGGAVKLGGEKTMAYSKQSFYLSLRDGSQFYLLPRNRATRRLARKFAAGLETTLGRPAVLRLGGRGAFEERPWGK